ncbi:MAG TPA: shikimate dehydrogenase [Candidatus Eremiobacteraeota bacterium]|nr:MAG: Shikimate dehydrogenase [bacterium ADurb.Bin363]HPZ06604.1 shikimate dehydrogenase [Candidatus Eremiobacteraeota bacterium]
MKSTAICISLGRDNIKETLLDLKEAEKSADIIEVRIDYMKDINESTLEELLKKRTKPIIITIRKTDEGGRFSGSEEERLNLLKKSIRLKADYVDIELSSGEEIISSLIENKENTKIICSYHNFKETPGKIKSIYGRIKKLKPHIIKIVTFGESINDNFKHFELLKNNKNLISFCMGLKGQISRILGAKYGSFLTFASLSNDSKTAEGQIAIEDLIDLYNINLLNKNTKILGVTGSYAENSLSKYMHNVNFREQGENYTYIPFKTEKEDLEEFMKNFKKFNFFGSAVTIPHKIDIIKYLDDIEDRAKKIGAVNTIVNKDGKLTGYNTDCKGAIDALSKKTELKDRKVLVLGAGGAARAICYGLKEKEFSVIIANRTEERAMKLAEELDMKICPLEDIYKYNYHIIINTTSIGMYPHINESIVEKDFLKGKVVFDIVYRPMMTKMLRDAIAVGSTVVEGYEMLLYQGIEQYKLWTGKEPSENLMRKILFEQLGKE